MRLRSGLAVLRHGPNGVQVGTDPRWAVRIEDLSPDEAHALVAAGPSADLERVGSQLPGPHTARLAQVARLLGEAGLATERAERRRSGPVGVEQVVAALLGRPDPARSRAQHCVGVIGLGTIGLAVASTLAASGVGTVLLDDPRVVRSADTGLGGYRWDDVGAPRDGVAARVLRDVAPDVALTGRSPDVVVLVEHGAVDPEQAPRLLAGGLAHACVVVREGDVSVGPLVVPGDGPCLRCLDLHRADLDPQWPALAHQLAGSGSTASDGAGIGAGEVPAVAAVCAGLVTAAVLAHLDGGATPLRGATFEVAVPHAIPLRREWAVHPACGCPARPEPAGAREGAGAGRRS
jgi:hypothetical protein